MENPNSLVLFGKKGNYYYNHPPPQNLLRNNNITIPPNFKILIIDDDIDFLKALEYRLIKKGIEVVAVESGFNAIEILKDEYFDLILLDLRMPHMNGVETFKKILKMKSRPFVVVMTAYSEDEQVEIVKKLNPFGFLLKPFDLDNLMLFIKERIKEEMNGNKKNSNN